MLTYPKLDLKTEQLRLLEFRGNDANGRLKFSLVVCGLRECSFVALSYTWDGARLVKDPNGKILDPRSWESNMDTATDAITVNNYEFLITPNLHAFLQRITCSKLVTKPFFADQICINQDDVNEQSHQVRLMGKIYSQAIEVIAWICPLESQGENSLRILHDHPRLQHALKGLDASLKKKLPRDKLETIADHIVGSVTSAYWSRQWIIQEVILAKSLILQIGKHSLDWEVLLNLVGEYSTHRSWMAQDSSYLHYFPKERNVGRLVVRCIEILRYKQKARLGTDGFRPRNLSSILVQLGNRDCKHQRDKIFSLTNLASTCIVPDYAEPLAIIFVRVLVEGLSGLLGMWWKDEESEHQCFKLCDFLLAAMTACDFKISNPTVALIISRVMDRCGISSSAPLVELIWSIQENVKQEKRSPLGLQKRWIKMQYFAMTMKLSRAQYSNTCLRLPEVDHVTVHWTTISRTYEEWIQLVDDVVNESRLAISRLVDPLCTSIE